MRGTLITGAVALALASPAPAAGADLFVGSSRAGASDAGPCTDANSPCVTIQAAVNKSQAQGGGAVRVLANPDGASTDTYAQALTLDGSAPVELIGAGRGVNGTRIAPSAGTPLQLADGTAARSLRVLAPTNGTAVTGAGGSTVDDVHAEAIGGVPYTGTGRVEDSKLIGASGAVLDGARLVRTEVVATLNGVVARLGTSQLLDVVVRARTTAGNPPTGDALKIGGSGVARAELRHVTLTGYPTRVRVDARGAAATLAAANSSFAESTGTDLQLHALGARAKLRTVNRAPARTAFSDGAKAGNVADTDPVDLNPGLTPDARLLPSSLLVDRGTPAGILAGDPDDAQDIGGQPRLQGAAPDIGADELRPSAPDGLRWVTIGTFSAPMWVTSPPGELDRYFVVQRLGRIFAVVNDQVLPTPALDISAKVTGDGEGGFQSIAFAPDFATTGRVYGFYNLKENPATPEIEFGDIVIAEWTIDPTNPNRIDPASERQVMYLEHSTRHNHNGGTLVFGPDGYLWISLGDGDTAPIPSQDLTKPLGKIMRIDPRQSGAQPYTVPPDNPFVGEPPALPEIWAYGVRNPFRMSFDAENGDLWIADVGQNRFEEANLLRGVDGNVPGANLGWRLTEGDVIFQSGAPVTPANAPPDYHGPAIVRRHDEGERSITGGSVVRDPTIPELEGHYLYADFFIGVTRSAVGRPGGVGTDGEIEGLPPVPGVTSYSTDGCGRVYATNLFTGVVSRLTTTGQCVPPEDACTVSGTNGNDDLTGTNGPDVVCGLGGDDVLRGLEGDDVISGGPGDDELIGGAGDDIQQGGTGSDLADYASSEAPVEVTVGTGADDGAGDEADDVQVDVERVRGGTGDDELTAGPSRSRLVGGGGADVLVGGAGNDKLEGHAGDDDLDGAGGNDELFGGDNADALSAVDGRRDRVVCGPAVDVSTTEPADVVDPSCE